jgi:hypothetical protein
MRELALQGGGALDPPRCRCSGPVPGRHSAGTEPPEARGQRALKPGAPTLWLRVSEAPAAPERSLPGHRLRRTGLLRREADRPLGCPIPAVITRPGSLRSHLSSE